VREQEDRTLVIRGQAQSGSDALSPSDLIKSPVGRGWLKFLNAAFDPRKITRVVGFARDGSRREICGRERHRKPCDSAQGLHTHRLPIRIALSTWRVGWMTSPFGAGARFEAKNPQPAKKTARKSPSCAGFAFGVGPPKAFIGLTHHRPRAPQTSLNVLNSVD